MRNFWSQEYKLTCNECWCSQVSNSSGTHSPAHAGHPSHIPGQVHLFHHSAGFLRHHGSHAATVTKSKVLVLVANPGHICGESPGLEAAVVTVGYQSQIWNQRVKKLQRVSVLTCYYNCVVTDGITSKTCHSLGLAAVVISVCTCMSFVRTEYKFMKIADIARSYNSHSLTSTRGATVTHPQPRALVGPLFRIRRAPLSTNLNNQARSGVSAVKAS